MSTRSLNLLVFREDRRQVSGPELRLALLSQLEALGKGPPREKLISALLRAGELECGVADENAAAAQPLAELSDSLAEALLTDRLPDHFSKIKTTVSQAPVPEWLNISTAEGFAYYGLHPLAYADALEKLPAPLESVVVVGIRSIGTTLSAMVAAAARLRGLYAERITVRPCGHPYHRQTEFSPAQLQVIQRGVASAAAFVIVDEGPGLSGSSFLSVAEALEKAGAARERIVLVCGHEPNADQLCSANAARRWRRFCCVPVSCDRCKPAGADVFIGAGQWRSRWFGDESAWPESWSNMERLKYVSRAERRLFKFAGFGHYGDSVIEREERAAAAGFGPLPRRESDGFVSYPWLDGRPMAADDLSPAVIGRLAQYCAFRAEAFRLAAADLRPLQQMAEHNLVELGFDFSLALKFERPVIADGRMQPHEWILTAAGTMLKTDSGSHGDDHFFPGPTDIAWDLAGTIVEWRMNADQTREFLDVYGRTSGDGASARIADFVRAYAVFRCAYCKMAASALQSTPEQARLELAAVHYAEFLSKLAGEARAASHAISFALH
jgi:hypothetical protein